MKENFKSLLTIMPKEKETYKEQIVVWMKWDSNDGDYIEKTELMDASILFTNKALILCLAYINCPCNFKGHGWNDDVFCHHVPDNTDIYGIWNILADNDFMIFCEEGYCHSLEEMTITYYDHNSKAFSITFNDIYARWKNMTYDEICNEINNA